MDFLKLVKNFSTCSLDMATAGPLDGVGLLQGEPWVPAEECVHNPLGGQVIHNSCLHPSVVDPKLFFSGSGSYLDLNFGSGSGSESGSGLFMKNTLEIQMIAKKLDCFEKFI
jgi:hypothetical protein